MLVKHLMLTLLKRKNNMNAANKIIYNVADFKSRDEFYAAVLQQIRLLIESHQVLSFHENPKIKGLYALQFGPAEANEKDSYPVWLTGEEIMYITAYANHNEYLQSKKYVKDYEDDEDNWDVIDKEDKNPDA